MKVLRLVIFFAALILLSGLVDTIVNPLFEGYGDGLWMSTRFTQNQSYDLRGDPFPILYDPHLSPWGMSNLM